MQCPNGYTMSAHGVCQPTGNYNRGGLTPRLNPRRGGEIDYESVFADVNPGDISQINEIQQWVADMTPQERSNCCSSYLTSVSQCNEGFPEPCPGYGCSTTSNCCACNWNSAGCTGMGSGPGGDWPNYGYCSCAYQGGFGCNFWGLCCGGGGSGGWSSYPGRSNYWGGYFGAGADAEGGGQGTGRRMGGPIKRKRRR